MKKLVIGALICSLILLGGCSKQKPKNEDPISTQTPQNGQADNNSANVPEGQAQNTTTSPAPQTQQPTAKSQQETVYNEAYKQVVAGISKYGKEMTSGGTDVIAQVISYMNTDEVKKQMDVMEDAVNAMEQSAKEEAEKQNAASIRASFDILKKVQSADGKLDSMSEEERSEVLGYVISLAFAGSEA